MLTPQNSKSKVQPEFMEFLRSLGWPVDISKHAGWTGNLTTSWKMSFNSSNKGSREGKGNNLTQDIGNILTPGEVKFELGMDVRPEVLITTL